MILVMSHGYAGRAGQAPPTPPGKHFGSSEMFKPCKREQLVRSLERVLGDRSPCLVHCACDLDLPVAGTPCEVPLDDVVPVMITAASPPHFQRMEIGIPRNGNPDAPRALRCDEGGPVRDGAAFIARRDCRMADVRHGRVFCNFGGRQTVP